jgi:hypothetical protein
LPTVTALPVAVTTAGTPRTSASVSYNGAHDRTVYLQIVSPTWATDDPTIKVTVAVQVSYDAGATWVNFCSMTCTPRAFGKSGLPPTLSCTAGDQLGARLARAFLSIDKATLTLGIDATT